MIYESMSKYDAEIAKCTDYYTRQCAAMEACRGQIAASNYVAANSRALILDSQATINKCEVDIPTRKLQLSQHLLMCKHELTKLNTRLKIVMGDIAVMTMILEMTDCDKKLMQMEHIALFHCTDECTKKSFIEFNHDGLQQKVNNLQSSLSHELMQDTAGVLKARAHAYCLVWSLVSEPCWVCVRVGLLCIVWAQAPFRSGFCWGVASRAVFGVFTSYTHMFRMSARLRL